MPIETIRILTRLRDEHSMSNNQFRRVHHFSANGKSNTTINVHLGYCGTLLTSEFSSDGNVRTRERLRIVLDKRDMDADWETAIAAALAQYPLP
ncbi:hypothetical protein [Archangium lansingense]|uniref:Uncharacterized protein n=1 Tax=Archangium lansingense TaxID=2995310 RepID=A0ABT4A3R8_9BACT|nr:hypothetical protein [Archangium lansinium]MCY1075996.1 hypothetical protein [Archangium lansinium]